MTKPLARTALTTSRALEFFSASELSKQMGFGPDVWGLAVLKELVDNAIDAAESADETPVVDVEFDEDGLRVRDNGPGLPEHVLLRSLDYMTRTSDKQRFVGLTRGQQGNALKCIWSVPYVLSGGKSGEVIVETQGKRHTITARLDPLSQEPVLERAEEATVGTIGTFFDVRGIPIASYGEWVKHPNFYRADTLAAAFALFSPGSTIRLNGKQFSCPCSNGSRLSSSATSPHWYTVAEFVSLLAAYAHEERSGRSRPQPLRDFLAIFDGLTGTGTRADTLRAAGLSGMKVVDMLDDAGIDRAKASALLAAMKANAKPVKPERLGKIGRAAFAAALAPDGDEENLRYRCKSGFVGDKPFMLEVAFNIPREEGYSPRLIGFNGSPLLGMRPAIFASAETEAYIDRDDCVAWACHLYFPGLQFTDRGKSSVDLPPGIVGEFQAAFAKVTTEFKTVKKRLDREQSMSQRRWLEAQRQRQRSQISPKKASYLAIPDAYNKASGDGKDPANARQIMYAARPKVLELTGGKCWENSNTFTQGHLPDYLDEHQSETANWDVVFDARGHLQEPHVSRRVDLGTIAVRDYFGSWRDTIPDSSEGEAAFDFLLGTCGPLLRYRYVLLVEKEGFNPLLERSNIAAKWDIAIASTKGQSTTAARRLIDWLSAEGVTVLVMHDLDIAGLNILHSLRSSNRRYQYTSKPNVIDIGLRLADAERMNLLREEVEYKKRKNDPRQNLIKFGATDEEQSLLVQRRIDGTTWRGERIELNAMTSPQFITYLEGKLAEVGVKKVVPSAEHLRHAYRLACRQRHILEEINAARERARSLTVEVPADLNALVGAVMARRPLLSWDQAIAEVVRSRTHYPQRSRG